MLSKRFSDVLTVAVTLSPQKDVSLTGIYGPLPLYELQVYGKIDEPQTAMRVPKEDIDYYIIRRRSRAVGTTCG